MSLQLSSKQSIADVWIAQLDHVVCMIEALLSAMCAILMLIVITFVIILALLVRHYRRNEPSVSGSSSSSSSADQERYNDALRDPSQRYRRVWRTVMSISDR